MSTIPPGVPPAPKKTNPLVWILVIVAGLFILGAIAVVGSGLFFMNKIRQQVSVEPGKVVLKGNGKDSVAISSSGSGADSSVTIKSADGTVKFGANAGAKVPTWVPDYPGSNPQGSFSAQTNEGSTGNFSFKTKDPVDKVVKFYEDGFKSSGMKVTSNMTNSDGKTSGAFLAAEDEGKTHTGIVAIATEGGETTVNVTYNVKK